MLNYFVYFHLPSSYAHPQSPCEKTTTKPFYWMSDILLDDDIPKLQQHFLCLRIRQAERHYNKGRVDKSIETMHKFINAVQREVANRLNEDQSLELSNEARKVINYLNGDDFVVVTGGVYQLDNHAAVADAAISLHFLSTNTDYSTVTDSNGLFSFEDIEADGQYIVKATTLIGEVGSSQGTALKGNQITSNVILVDLPGNAKISGVITNHDMTPAVNSLVHISFPDSGRSYSTKTNELGNYSMPQVHTDGTLIMLAFDPESGAVNSTSSHLLENQPELTIDLTLSSIDIVNPELVNTDFSDGLNGWKTEGDVTLIDRALIFGNQE